MILRKYWGLIFFIFFAKAIPVWCWGQSTTHTAQEILAQAESAFLAGDSAKAEPLLSQFISDFGSSKEAEPVLERIMSWLALSQLQQKKYGAALESTRRYLDQFPQGPSSREFSFWYGICLFKENEAEKAISTLTASCHRFPQDSQVFTAQMTIGAAFLIQHQFKEAATHFAQLAEQSGTPKSLLGQARTFQLHALLQQSDLLAAFALVQSMEPFVGELDALAIYHLLLLQLGDQLREKNQHREALYVLQRVWNKERLIQNQEQRLVKLEQQLARSEKTRNEVAQAFRLRETVNQIRSELDKLKKLPDYDMALKLRIAECFFTLQRYRESAILLSEILKRLPAGSLLEQTHFRLLHTYIQMKRWDEAIICAEQFLKRFDKSKSASHVLYLQGDAYQKAGDFVSATTVFQRILKDDPEFAQADRVAFLFGYTSLMSNHYETALATFDGYPKDFPKSNLLEASYYWKGMTYSLAKQFDSCRETLQNYLKLYPKGQFKGEAIFRRAHSLYAKKDFGNARQELILFLQDYPSHSRSEEAAILLGDSCFALGEIEQGIAYFKRVSRQTPRFYEYAYFQVGKAYKLLENHDAMRAHYETFIKNNPRSGRYGEALYGLAWLHQQQGQPEMAQKLYWDSIEKYGNDPAISGIEDMLLGVRKLYKGDESRIAFLIRLQGLRDQAVRSHDNVLAVRLAWALAQFSARQEPDKARTYLVESQSLAAIETTSARILADMADALRESGQANEAKALYEGIFMWHPRAIQKDRAYAGLGLIAVQQGREQEALEYYARFETELIQSTLRPQVLKSKADLLLKRRQFKPAIETLEALLKSPAAKGRTSVEALFNIGQAYNALGQKEKALPYFERIYVMHNRYPDYVAKAYWQRGQTLENLKLGPQAKEVYQEFISRSELNQFESYRQAEQRLKFFNQDAS